MTINSSDFEYVRQLVRQYSAVQIPDDKQYLVESRLTAIAREHQIDSVRQLINKLRTTAFNYLHQAAIEAMMISETFFFRDTYPFAALQDNIIPKLIEKRDNERTLKIWSAACSSGQELYSIAILLREYFPQLYTWKIALMGSDISHQILSLAREGCYNQHEMNRGLSPELREKYFQHQGKTWQLNTEIRKLVEFHYLNLVEDWSKIPRMDIIFLRNVLIYFDIETKKKMLDKVKHHLRSDGYLFLGGGESLVHLDDRFQPIQYEKTVFYQLR